MKSVLSISAVLIGAVLFSNARAFAGPLVSSGGIVVLTASCYVSDLDIVVANYDGKLTATVNKNGGERTNLLHATVNVKNSENLNRLEFVSLPGQSPAFDLTIASPKNAGGEFEGFLAAQLSHSSVLTSQPVKCVYAQAPQQ